MTTDKITSGLELPIMESYFTIQGEGYHSGKPAFFIRTGGCDVGCHWCDTKDSWPIEGHPVLSIEKIVEATLQSGAESAVITGGEPVMYNLAPLTELFLSKNIKVHIETSGAYELTGFWDWICLSPKKTVPPHDGIHERANELKIIVHNNDDFEWAEEHAKKVGKACKLFLQPEWGVAEEMIPKIIDYIKANQEWAISLQSHKYLGIP
ncbi:MAG: 7-carboxy-7-deazaguanine synthase QueE [Bacteroidetes bacterium]|nr:MAG: 7-carboxy-7-deazaguanine synthase QueE [Bacteroidota bacterium]